jgi:transposase
MAKVKAPEILELSDKVLAGLSERLESGNISASDCRTLKALISIYGWLIKLLTEQKLSIKRLKRVFSIKTEKSEKILKEAECSKGAKGSSLPDECKKGKGHGRNGVSAYQNVERIKIEHEQLKPGAKCPECPKGKLYQLKKPAFVIRLTGNAPINGRIYELERLRCSSCQKIFKASLPEEAGKKKYDERAGAVISLLKYGNGFPFYRLENLQKEFGIPLPATTQWELAEGVGNIGFPIYRELIDQGAQGEVIHNDDTGVKILSLLSDIKQERKERIGGAQQKGDKAGERSGMFTTGIVSKVGKREIALYFSGRNHAGENLEKLLSSRSQSLGPPVQMCDAEARNKPKEAKTEMSNCLVHGRRKFFDLADTFPSECRIVIEALAKAYGIDRITKEQEMSPAERLRYHQNHSGPVMSKLRDWLDKQFEERKVEPNSSLGSAVKYMINHWEKLTAFLRIESAPLDNNAAERILKKVILHRKNSYFYRTEVGSAIGDILMSIIQTCNLAKVNAFEYLVSIQKHAGKVLLNPEQWLPWNYKTAAKI